MSLHRVSCVRIATWNVNSIGARLPRLLDWLERTAPDVAALQETKCTDTAFPYEELERLGYSAMHVGDGRWNGVAIVAKGGLTPLSSALPGFTEARYANALAHPVGGGRPLQVISVYVPNGRTIDDAQYPYKLDWLAALRRTLDDTDPGNPAVLMGDFNVALSDEDVWDIRSFRGSTHVTEPERAGVRALLDWGLTDVRARPGKNDRPFTYWDYRAGMFPKDMGMRIDYVLASRPVTILDAYVDREARKGKQPSDHAPIVVDIELQGIQPRA
jgi:exodeoxyribonuclease III